MFSSHVVSYPVYKGSNYDASTTNLSYSIPSANGSTDIVLSFLSPITPTSTVRQSIPAAYLTVYITSGSDVAIYIDVNGQWVSGDRGNDITWGLETHKNLKTWKIKRRVEQRFTEYRDRAEWGALYFSGPSVSDLSNSPKLAGHSAV